MSALQRRERGKGVGFPAARAARRAFRGRARSSRPPPRSGGNRYPASACASAAGCSPSDVTRAGFIASPFSRRAPRGRGAAIRSAMSTRIICGPAARKPRRVSRERSGGVGSTTVESGGRSGMVAGGRGAQAGAPAHRFGLQHRRHEQIERADADAEPGHGAALVAVERGERRRPRPRARRSRLRRPASRARRVRPPAPPDPGRRGRRRGAAPAPPRRRRAASP